jgi:hypothetical protein
MSLRRKLSGEEQAEVEKHEQQEQVARKLREQVERFKATFSLEALLDQLPLCFPSPVQLSEPLSFRALSWYTYPGWVALAVPKQLAVLSAFYLVLHLIDFSSLRAELVALTVIHLNGPGQTPFDPVSLFLCCLLRLEKGLGWKELAKFLAGPEGECWHRLFGFHDHTPGASTMRHFYHALGTAFDTDLCPRFIELLHTAGLLPEQSTHPTTPPERGLPLAVDGMLHEAHSSMRCGQVTDTCYQPITPDHGPRPCPAREAGREGCDCTASVCAQACRFTTPRDPEARLIHYSGRNQEGEEDPSHARNVYGYRSYPQALGDDELHAYWVAHTSVQTAISDERIIFPADFTHLQQRLPQIPIGDVVADAALGYRGCLNTVYDAKAIPVIAIRRDKTDKDKTACQLRGYDKNGHPLCAHGYPMSFNGVDYERLRACWTCRQVCARLPETKPEDEDCPFRDPERPLGQVRHVSRALVHPDGTRHERLARLYPYGSPLWQEHYGSRKNAVEGRNSQLARLGLKRVWSYGLAGATADITFADLLINLRTLGRLVQEATLLVAQRQAADP